MIRVGINARLLHSANLRGWNRYTLNLLAELPALGVDLVLFADRPLHESHLARLPAGRFTVRLAPPQPYPVWEQRWLPRQCGLDRVDLLHSPFNFGLPWSSPCPRVLTLHDAIDQIYYGRIGGWRRRWRPGSVRDRLYHWSARTRAHRIITDSEHAKDDLAGFLGLPAARITAIPLAADPVFHQAVTPAERARARERHGLAGPYVFYVGGWEGRKNVPFLVRGFAAATLEGQGVELVLAGGRDDERAELVALARSLGVAERVRLLGWIAEDDLPALYAEALGFVYPSLYEGFGLQLCEAMAVACPTLAARASCLPEVLGDGGETFDPADPEDLARQLRRLATDPEHRAALADRARARSADFSWTRTAEATLAVYHEAIAGPERALPCAPAARS